MWVQYTYFFSDGSERGWSFSLYRDKAGTDLTISGDGAGWNILNTVSPLLGENALCTYIRLSKVDVRGDASLYQRTSTWPIGDPAKPIQQANSAVLVNCYDTTLVKRKPLYLRGIWDTAIAGKVLANPAGWVTKRDAFIAALKSDGWSFRTRTTPATVQIASVAASAQGNKIVITTAAAAFVAPFGSPKRVRVTGINAIPKVPREIMVIPADATHCTTKNDFALPTLPSGGTLTTWDPGFQLIQNVFFVRPVTRRAGKIFSPSAGGRSTSR